MKKYFDTINKKQTFTFRNEEETIISTDDRVKCFWEQLEQGEEIEFNDSNLPIKVKYELKEDGAKYSYYLPIEDGIYKPDIIAIDEQEIKQAIDKTNSKTRQALAQGDWKVIRELERLMLKDTELNTEREALRASVVEVTNG